MIGSYVSDDFHFYFDPIDIEILKDGAQPVSGHFVSTKNRGEGLVKMDLIASVDYQGKIKGESNVIINFGERCCFLYLKPADFTSWFIYPNEHTLRHGPNWRVGSTNVYVKTEHAIDAKIFQQTLRNFLLQAT